MDIKKVTKNGHALLRSLTLLLKIIVIHILFDALEENLMEHLFIKLSLKVHQCRFENLPIFLCLYKYNNL